MADSNFKSKFNQCKLKPFSFLFQTVAVPPPAEDPGRVRQPCGLLHGRVLRPARRGARLPGEVPPAGGAVDGAGDAHRGYHVRLLHRPHLVREIRQDLLLLSAQGDKVGIKSVTFGVISV